MRQLSICIPTYMRVDMVVEAFIEVKDDDRVKSIIINDDASDIDCFKELEYLVGGMNKVKLYRNEKNLDCYANKAKTLSLSDNAWNALIDSDNVIDKSYIDKIFEVDEWDNTIAYMPSYAKPTFNYKEFEGVLVTKENVNQYFERPFFSTMLNCMNYFVNRNEYLRVWDGSQTPNTADSIYQNYNWLKAGNSILVLSGLEYFHRIHDQSHYILNNHKTGNFYQEVEQKIKQL